MAINRVTRYKANKMKQYYIINSDQIQYQNIIIK
jgi:hypothetical protein